MSDLLPCPFCGETKIFLNEPSQFWPRGSINCPACMVVMPGEIPGERREHELIEQWNGRAAIPASAQDAPQPLAWRVTAGGNIERHLFENKRDAQLMRDELEENGWEDVLLTPLYAGRLMENNSHDLLIPGGVTSAGSQGPCSGMQGRLPRDANGSELTEGMPASQPAAKHEYVKRIGECEPVGAFLCRRFYPGSSACTEHGGLARCIRSNVADPSQHPSTVRS